MEKAYLLLRQNTESGPFTLNELKQLHLQPTDLIWIEGVSQSWSAPVILSDESPNDFRGPDTNDWVSPRSDEGRQAPEQGGSQTSFAVEGLPVQNSRLSESYREAEDIELIFHKKDSATVSLVQLLGVAAITAVLALAWDNRFELLQSQEHAVSYASTPVVFTPEPPKPVPKQTATLLPAEDSTNELPQQPINGVRNLVKSKKVLEAKDEISKPLANGSAESEVQQPEVEAPPLVEVPAPTETKIVDTPPADTQESVDAGEQVKKKTLGQAIKGLFKKKNKEGRKKEENTGQ